MMDNNIQTVPAGFAYGVLGLLIILVICSFAFAGWGVFKFMNRPSRAVLALGKSLIVFDEEPENEENIENEASDENLSPTSSGKLFTINGNPLSFNEQQPVMIDEWIFVPVTDSVFEALGYSVEWNALTNTATISGEDSIIIKLDENTFIANGETHLVTPPAQYVNNVAMLPVEPLAKSIGYTVAQNENGVYMFRETPYQPHIDEPQRTPVSTRRPRPEPTPEPVVVILCSPCGTTGTVTCTSCNGVGGGRGTSPADAGIPYAVSSTSDVWYCTTCVGGKIITCSSCSGSGFANQ
jgi:hypothetical protein